MSARLLLLFFIKLFSLLLNPALAWGIGFDSSG